MSLNSAHFAALNPLSSSSLLTSLGALGVFLVLFAETGLLIGIFLPGDSLLFTAGLFCTTSSAHKVHLSLPLVILAAITGALLGAQTGFYIGRAGGRPLLERSRSPVLHKGADRGEELLRRYGYGKAIVLARFIPVVRTVLNPLAGALRVPTGTFTIWQAVGGIVWSAGITLAGYALGSTVPGIDRYLLPVIAVIVIVSGIPIVIELRRTRAAARADSRVADSRAADSRAADRRADRARSGPRHAADRLSGQASKPDRQGEGRPRGQHR